MNKIIPLVLIILMLSGCSAVSGTYSDSFFAMDTYMTVTVNGKNAEKAVKEAETEIKKLDKKLSAHSESSEIYKLNKNGSAKLSRESADLIKRALKFNKLTDGAFNPAMLGVSELWGFSDKKYKVPSDKELAEALKKVKPEKITVKNNTVDLNVKGMKIDLGGIAKGYTSEKIVTLLKKKGIDSALLNLGGNVQALGSKPDGSGWNIAIENPDKKSYLGQLAVKDKAVVTSGGYERYFKKNGKTYHHILNSKTGNPAESGLESVTVISGSGTLADALSTSLFVMGEDKAVKFWAKSDKDFDIILYTKGGDLKISEGLADKFKSDMNYTVIKRSDYG